MPWHSFALATDGMHYFGEVHGDDQQLLQQAMDPDSSELLVKVSANGKWATIWDSPREIVHRFRWNQEDPVAAVAAAIKELSDIPG